MKIDQKTIDRLDALIKFGEDLKPSPTSRSPGVYAGPTTINYEKAHQWAISCLNMLKRIFLEDSDHYNKFNNFFPKIHEYASARKVLGILKAAKDDYENGYLFDTRSLIQAEVFDDLLEQAQHLLDSGYYAPAAVIAGSVLEDGLRKLCDRKGITLLNKATIEPLNIALAKAGIYNTLTQKRVTVLADIRNKAAHGKWSEFSASDVEQMIIQVRSFMENYFS